MYVLCLEISFTAPYFNGNQAKQTFMGKERERPLPNYLFGGGVIFQHARNHALYFRKRSRFLSRCVVEGETDEVGWVEKERGKNVEEGETSQSSC